MLDFKTISSFVSATIENDSGDEEEIHIVKRNTNEIVLEYGDFKNFKVHRLRVRLEDDPKTLVLVMEEVGKTKKIKLPLLGESVITDE